MLAKLLEDTLAQWRLAERLLRDLEAGTEDYLAVRAQAELMSRVHGDLTNGGDRSEAAFAQAHDAIEQARTILGDVASRMGTAPG